MTLTNNVPFRFCHLGDDWYDAFNLYVVRRGDKSNIISHIISDFLNGDYSVYDLLNYEDLYVKKRSKDSGAKLDEKSLHVSIDKDLYDKYISRCTEYGISPMVVGRALVLLYLNKKLATSL